jgi:hypothetical protein
MAMFIYGEPREANYVVREFSAVSYVTGCNRIRPRNENQIFFRHRQSKGLNFYETKYYCSGNRVSRERRTLSVYSGERLEIRYYFLSKAPL